MLPAEYNTSCQQDFVNEDNKHLPKVVITIEVIPYKSCKVSQGKVSVSHKNPASINYNFNLLNHLTLNLITNKTI
jgi:hypothetical protein